MTDVAGVKAFHGHMCPGLAVGIRAAEIALKEIGAHSSDEEVVAIVETDMCGVDAIQYMTGCTFGKGNLIHRDHGKHAFTFIRRSDRKAIRILTRPEAWGEPGTAYQDLFARVRSREATPDERARFQVLHEARAQRILDAPIETLFTVEAVDLHLPEKARLYESVQCEECGEMAMETRIRLLGGQKLCLPCYKAAERSL